ncbi:MAG: PDZ domain-containing protein [Mariniblastus sp.]|nr:PDZ domain-containing protein [Mariniblastus sp.]
MRLVKANELNLAQFQFDYDLTFAVLFMNTDRTIYGRYGTRSSVEDAEKHMSMQGLAATMRGVLEIHEGDLEVDLSGKQSLETDYRTPNDLPSLAGKFKSDLDYQGAVAKNCLHCHQIQDAQREIYRASGQPIPDRLLFPHPHPSVIGLVINPDTKATVQKVVPASPADRAGLRPGDKILSIDNQPILSIADIQWALHTAPDRGALEVEISRGDRQISKKVRLGKDWRFYGDLTWRVTSWPLRRMGTGGIVFRPATDQQRKANGIPEDVMALRVHSLGKYGPHGAATRAGVKKDDIMTRYDGHAENWTPSQLLGYIGKFTRTGQKIQVTMLRKGQPKQLTLPIQK